MCGIAGIVSINRRPVDPHAIKRMCDTLSHRGPDDAGYAYFRVGSSDGGEGGAWCAFADPKFRHVNEHLPVLGSQFFHDEMAASRFSVALGHRRLAIIDLTHYGHQPMASSDCRYWITFNGEIYNFPQLRDELTSQGHIFRTRSDTEVILHLWEQHGPAAMEKLDGMFAFAIYDRVSNELTLVRDRFGVKPLYYAFAGGALVFASEIKAILASGLVNADIDAGALVEYFTFQNLYSPQTLFDGVKLLEPGEYLTVRPDSWRTSHPQRYHSAFADVDTALADPQQASELVSDAFAQAVKRQLVSDVEVGSYLSGGMDSGSIVAVAGRSIPRLLTFTGGFDLTNVNGIEQGFDERRSAEQLSHLLQTEHYDVVLHAGDMPAAMERITWHMDDPRVGMCHQNWYVAKLASRFVKVCLAGAGGDELFAGYPWRYSKAMSAATFGEFDELYYHYWHRLLPPSEMPSLFAPELREHHEATRGSFERVMTTAPTYRDDLTRIENMVQRALHFEFKTFLHGFLVTEDRISMAHSLETRVPFLDNNLADLAWKLRPSLKLNTEALVSKTPGAHMETADGKRVLRKAMESFLPREFTQQRKQGFSPPDENWYRGPSMDYINTVLTDRLTQQRPWFDQRYVRARLDEHFTGRKNHRLLIWSLLSIEWMQRHFCDSSNAATETWAKSA